MSNPNHPRRLLKGELDKIGHAISTLVQQRYVWLFIHICRTIVLNGLDSGVLGPLPEFYFFSEEDEKRGSEPVQVHHVMDLVQKDVGVFAYSTGESPKSYDYQFTREITRAGIRGIFLVAIQSYLEHYKIEGIMRRNMLPYEELFVFIRQARNIICHANSVMDSDRIRPCSWRGVRIENNGRTLKLSDQHILRLVDDAIEAMAEIYIEHGRAIDYVSLNLGYSVGYIQRYIEANRALL